MFRLAGALNAQGPREKNESFMSTSKSNLSTSRIFGLCALATTMGLTASANAQVRDTQERHEGSQMQASHYSPYTRTPGGDVRWTYRQIPVCWEHWIHGRGYERDLVREALARTWEDYADIEFVGWQECYPGEEGIRIAVTFDEKPHVKALGRNIDGVVGGMVLNFDDDAGLELCRGTYEECISAAAVHQFGQALGFSHQEPRGYGPRRDCLDDVPARDAGRYGGGYFIDPYERDSIMNYCSRNWNNFSLRSEADRIAAQQLYPTYPLDIQVQNRRRGQVALKNGHQRLGHWYADRGGAMDSDWDRGYDEIVMSFDPTTIGDVAELTLVVNDDGQSPLPPYNDPDWIFLGFWDVDRGGARDTSGNWGHWNMGMFIKLRQHDWEHSLDEVKLTASNRRRPAYDRNYVLDGFWDVSRRGSEGTDGRRGKFMMGLHTSWTYGPY